MPDNLFLKPEIEFIRKFVQILIEGSRCAMMMGTCKQAFEVPGYDAFVFADISAILQLAGFNGIFRRKMNIAPYKTFSMFVFHCLNY